MAGKGKPGPAKGTTRKIGKNKGNAGKGRPKGAPNKATKNARDAIAAFVDRNTPRLERLLSEIEQADGARAAFGCIVDVLEFGVPKLARTELTGLNGGPMQVADVSRRTDAELMEIINRPIHAQIGQASTIDVGENTARNATLAENKSMDYTNTGTEESRNG
jgi:hypothetical protein